MIKPGSKYEENLRKAIQRELEDTLVIKISTPREFQEACEFYLDIKEFKINPIPKKFQDCLCACYACGGPIDVPHVIQLRDSPDVVEQLPFHPECVVEKVMNYYTGGGFINDFMVPRSKSD